MTSKKDIENLFKYVDGFRALHPEHGYYNDEERKKPFRYFGNNFVFFAPCADLSKGLEVYKNENYKYVNNCRDTWEITFMRDFMYFGMWWEREVRQYLNGCMPLDCVKIEIDPELELKINIKKL